MDASRCQDAVQAAVARPTSRRSGLDDRVVCTDFFSVLLLSVLTFFGFIYFVLHVLSAPYGTQSNKNDTGSDVCSRG